MVIGEQTVTSAPRFTLSDYGIQRSFLAPPPTPPSEVFGVPSIRTHRLSYKQIRTPYAAIKSARTHRRQLLECCIRRRRHEKHTLQHALAKYEDAQSTTHGPARTAGSHTEVSAFFPFSSSIRVQSTDWTFFMQTAEQILYQQVGGDRSRRGGGCSAFQPLSR